MLGTAGDRVRLDQTVAYKLAQFCLPQFSRAMPQSTLYFFNSANCKAIDNCTLKDYSANCKAIDNNCTLKDYSAKREHRVQHGRKSCGCLSSTFLRQE